MLQPGANALVTEQFIGRWHFLASTHRRPDVNGILVMLKGDDGHTTPTLYPLFKPLDLRRTDLVTYSSADAADVHVEIDGYDAETGLYAGHVCTPMMLRPLPVRRVGAPRFPALERLNRTLARRGPRNTAPKFDPMVLRRSSSTRRGR